MNMEFNTPFTTTEIVVRRLILVPVKQQRDVFRRSFEVGNLDNRSLGNLENIIGNSLEGKSKISAAAIANASPNLFKQSDVPTDLVAIANGWSTPRLRFLLETSSIDPSDGFEIKTFIQGYSDYHDPSMQTNSIDPNMSLHINSVVNVKTAVAPGTNHTTSRVIGSFNIISDNNGGSYVEDFSNDLKLIRPMDVFNTINARQQYGDENVIDTRNGVSSMCAVSRRSNNIGSDHISKVINSVVNAKLISDVGHNPADMLMTGSVNTSEQNPQNTPLIECLSASTGIPAPTVFTVNQLLELDGNLPNVTYLQGNEQTIYNETSAEYSALSTNDTEYMDTATIEASIATTVSDSLSSLLMESMISKASMTITNMIPGMDTQFIFSDVKSFMGEIVDVGPYANIVKEKFLTLIMPVITKNNAIGIDLVIEVDVLGSTSVGISVNGNPQIVYRLPTFSDALYSPVITNAANQGAITTDMQDILGVTEGVYNAVNYDNDNSNGY